MSPATMPQSTTPVVGFKVDTTSSTTDVFLAKAAEDPNLPLLAKPVDNGWDEVSAGEFLTQVRTAAKGLIASGVEVGDRIAIFGPTSFEWTLSDYAVWFAGANLRAVLRHLLGISACLDDQGRRGRTRSRQHP